MPKGDRLKLKADPEDGTTPISNLLLEAVALARLPGLQTRAIIYLWRKTYGWVDNDGNRKKRCEIGLKEWGNALDSIKSSIAGALSELQSKNIITRTLNKDWGTYTYQINTDIKTWNSNSIDLDKLSKTVQYARAEQSTIPYSTKRANSKGKPHRTVPQNRTVQYENEVHPTLYKEKLNKDKEKGSNKKYDHMVKK